MPAWDRFFLRELHPALWLAWMIYWLISARGSKRTVRRETGRERVPYTIPLALAALLFFAPGLRGQLGHLLWPRSHAIYGLGTALLVAGLSFTVWARLVLGRNCIGTVTVKQDHELIQGGPYRWVRHPIYTGLLVALTGSALAEDRWSALAAVALAVGSCWIKLLREEAWMRETFGEKYQAYCARTARLVPFIL